VTRRKSTERTVSRADIDPDPVSIALFVLTAVSAAADIFVAVRQEHRETERERLVEERRQVGIALVDVEARLLDVKSAFETIGLLLSDHARGGPFRFGANVILLTDTAYRAVNVQIQRMLNAIRQLHKAVEQCVWQMYRYEVTWNESPVPQLIDVREECNRILWESRRLDEALEGIDGLIDRTIEAVRKLRVWIDIVPGQ
jgi:hypothetical protein